MEAAKPSRIISLWTDGQRVGMVLFNKSLDLLEPIKEWESKQNTLDIDFTEVIEEWLVEDGEPYPIETIYLSEIQAVDPAHGHPLKEFIPEGMAQITLSIPAPLEASLAHKKLTKSGKIDLSNYQGRRVIEEVVSKFPEISNSWVMAYLLAAARFSKITSAAYISSGKMQPHPYRNIF